MEIRFVNGADRARLDVHLPTGCPVPRVGDSVVLPRVEGAECSRWQVKSVVWDYSGGVSVDVVVVAAVPARVPSFAAYGD